jgi:hypothetical protein
MSGKPQLPVLGLKKVRPVRAALLGWPIIFPLRDLHRINLKFFG